MISHQCNVQHNIQHYTVRYSHFHCRKCQEQFEFVLDKVIRNEVLGQLKVSLKKALVCVGGSNFQAQAYCINPTINRCTWGGEMWYNLLELKHLPTLPWIGCVSALHLAFLPTLWITLTKVKQLLTLNKKELIMLSSLSVNIYQQTF